MTFNVNDILYTRDGRKCGNLCIIAVDPTFTFPNSPQDLLGPTLCITCISDYGNVINLYPTLSKSFSKQFYKTLGKADSTHKHHDYYLNHPEVLL